MEMGNTYRIEPDRKYVITREIKNNAMPCSNSFCLLAVAERMQSSASHVSVGKDYIAWKQEGRHYRAPIEENQDFVERIARPFDQGYDIKVGTKFSIVGIMSRPIRTSTPEQRLATARYNAEIKAGIREKSKVKRKSSPPTNKRWGIVA